MNFIKKTLVAIATVMLTAGAATASTLPELKDAVRTLYSNGKPVCSAVFVSPRTAFTAAHCIPSPRSAITVGDFAATPLLLDKERDRAVLVFDEDVVDKGVDIASYEEIQSLEWGDPVISVGYPGSQFRPDLDQIFILDGRFLGERGSMVYKDNLRYSTTVPVGSGHSGGGLFAPFVVCEYSTEELNIAGFVADFPYTYCGPEYKFIGITVERDPLNLSPEGVASPIY